MNETFAKKFYPGQNAVGQFIIAGNDKYPIVGVVGDVRQTAVDEVPSPRVYVSVYQIPRIRMNLVARTRRRTCSCNGTRGLRLGSSDPDREHDAQTEPARR